MRANVTIDTLGDLDGGSVRHICNAAINAAVADLDDRGDDGKPRKVTIVLTMTKMNNGLADISVEAKAAMPVYRSASTIARGTVDAKSRKTVLEFQATSPDNPDQKTMDFDDSETEA